MKKSCSSKEGHPPSWVNFSARLYEKKFDPFPQAKTTGAYFDFPALTELTRLGEPKRLYGEKLVLLKGWHYHRKGDLARRVTL